MKNSQAKNLLIIENGKKCLLTGKKAKKQDLTFHHIVKREWGGTATPDNGANLISEIHNWLHCCIEQNNEELYILINECLLLYKKVLYTNNIELIRQFEEECQPLFQEEYDKYLERHPVYQKKKRKKR